MGEQRKAFTVLVAKPEMRNMLYRCRVGARIILKFTVMKFLNSAGLDRA
jgi:hypothetical protein